MKKLTLICFVSGAMGCSVMVRSPEQYRDDTAALLQSQNAKIKQCYDDALKTQSTLSGQVTVKFTVQPETGRIVNPTLDPTGTTAPEPLGQCVVQSIDGLVLEKPDDNEGQATFTFDFSVASAPGGGVPGPAAPPGAPGGAPGVPGVSVPGMGPPG